MPPKTPPSKVISIFCPSIMMLSFFNKLIIFLKTVPFGKIGPTMFPSPLQVFPLVPALTLLLKITLT